jgi:hypothetical protein
VADSIHNVNSMAGSDDGCPAGGTSHDSPAVYRNTSKVAHLIYPYNSRSGAAGGIVVCLVVPCPI